MDLFQVVVLALIQGLTEFLPISSSAHLILPSQILGWTDQGLAFDVAVHVGTLAAVVIYFRKDLRDLIVAWFGQFGERGQTQESRLAWYIVWATVPVCLAGLFLEHFIETYLRSSLVIAAASIFFGLVLWWSDVRGKQMLTLQHITLGAALLIGVAQAVALIPGTSRSGITMTMALFLGFTRTDAARFSFLLSIPVIVIGGVYEGIGLLGAVDVDWLGLFTGVAVSLISAYLCIHYFLEFISKLSMLPFVVYRVILGFVLIGLYFLN
jgi:undecaprenyl-diphosphatase